MYVFSADHPIIVFNCGGLVLNLIGKLRESFVCKVLFSMGMTDQHYKFYIEGDKLKLLIKSEHLVNSLPGIVKNQAQQTISSVDSVDSSYAVVSNTTDSRRRGFSRRPNHREGVNANVVPPIAPERAVRPSQDDSQERFEFTDVKNLKLTTASLVVLVLREHFDTFKQEGINDEVMALRLLTSLAHGIRRSGSIRKGCNWVYKDGRHQGNRIAPSESRAFKFKDRSAKRLIVVENIQEHNSYTSTKVCSH